MHIVSCNKGRCQPNLCARVFTEQRFFSQEDASRKPPYASFVTALANRRFIRGDADNPVLLPAGKPPILI